MKNDFSKHIHETWHIYVIWLIVAFVFASWISGILTALKPEERMTVFIASNSSYATVTRDIYEGKPGYLKDLEVRCADVNDNNSFYSMYQAYKDSDVFILPESVIDKEFFDKLYLPITLQDSQLETLLSPNDSKSYGIKVFNKTTKDGVCKKGINYTKDGKEDEDYYLLVNKNSKHLSGLTVTDYDRDGAKSLISIILNYDTQDDAQ